MAHKPAAVLKWDEYPHHQINSDDIEKLGFHWFMRDNIPASLGDGVYLYNMDSSRGNGSHWMSFCLKKPKIFYYDPFGTDLNGFPPTELRKWGAQNGYKMLVANEEDMQHIKSWLCGWYAVYFALKMKKHYNQLTPKSFDQIVQKGLTKYPSSHNVETVAQL